MLLLPELETLCARICCCDTRNGLLICWQQDEVGPSFFTNIIIPGKVEIQTADHVQQVVRSVPSLALLPAHAGARACECFMPHTCVPSGSALLGQDVGITRAVIGSCNLLRILAMHALAQLTSTLPVIFLLPLFFLHRPWIDIGEQDRRRMGGKTC